MLCDSITLCYCNNMMFYVIYVFTRTRTRADDTGENWHVQENRDDKFGV